MFPGYQWRHSWIKTQSCSMAQPISGEIAHRKSRLALLRKVPVLWLIGHVRLFFMNYLKNLQTYNNNVIHFSAHLHEIFFAYIYIYIYTHIFELAVISAQRRGRVFM